MTNVKLHSRILVPSNLAAFYMNIDETISEGQAFKGARSQIIKDH
jgi:hypothetical protein